MNTESARTVPSGGDEKELQRVREILFGKQVHVIEEHTELVKKEITKRLDAMEASIRQEFDRLRKSLSMVRGEKLNRSLISNLLIDIAKRIENEKAAE